jgi:hypothetical protein
MTERSRIGIVALIGVLALSAGAFAQGAPGDYAYRQDPFFINLGGQLIDLSTSTQVKGGAYKEGTEFDVNRSLGLDKSPNTWRLDAGWRFFDRHQLVFSYYQVNNSHDKTLNRSFTYDGYDYTVGSQVHTSMDESYWQIKYRWYFVQGTRGEFGLQVGLSYNDYDLGLKLNSHGEGGGHQADLGYNVNRSMGAPAATLGIAGSYQFTPKCFFRGDAGWLRANISGYTGTVWNLRATVDYYPWPNVGFGGGYEYNKIKIEADKSNWDGYLKNDLSSFVGYISFKF